MSHTQTTGLEALRQLSARDHARDHDLAQSEGEAAELFRADLRANVADVDRSIARYEARGHRASRVASRRPAVRARARTSHSTNPGHRRRTSSSSATSSTDPGDPDGEPPRRGGHPRHFIEDGAAICCPFCAQPLHERDGAHCGGCAVTWWDGVR